MLLFTGPPNTGCRLDNPSNNLSYSPIASLYPIATTCHPARFLAYRLKSVLLRNDNAKLSAHPTPHRTCNSILRASISEFEFDRSTASDLRGSATWKLGAPFH